MIAPFIPERLMTSPITKEAQFENIKIIYKDFLLPRIPKTLVEPSIMARNFLGKTPVKYLSQSIFIPAQKNENA